MTEQEKKDWLNQIATRCNQSDTANYMFVASSKSTKIEQYIADHGGVWVRKNKNLGDFKLPNGLLYHVVFASDNARGYKPLRAIIDSAIDYDILQTVILPTCIRCHHMEII